MSSSASDFLAYAREHGAVATAELVVDVLSFAIVLGVLSALDRLRGWTEAHPRAARVLGVGVWVAGVYVLARVWQALGGVV